jgi:hypothetical protein
MQEQIPKYLNNLYKDYLYPRNYSGNIEETLDIEGIPDILDTAAEVMAALTIG